MHSPSPASLERNPNWRPKYTTATSRLGTPSACQGRMVSRTRPQTAPNMALGMQGGRPPPVFERHEVYATTNVLHYMNITHYTPGPERYDLPPYVQHFQMVVRKPAVVATVQPRRRQARQLDGPARMFHMGLSLSMAGTIRELDSRMKTFRRAVLGHGATIVFFRLEMSRI